MGLRIWLKVLTLSIVFLIQLASHPVLAKSSKKIKEQPLTQTSQTQYDNFKSEAAKIQHIYASNDTEVIRQKLNIIQNVGDHLMSKAMHEEHTTEHLIVWVDELSKSIEELVAIAPKLRDLAPKLQNEFIFPFAELQNQSLVLLECSTQSNAACENINDWTSEITKLNNHLYHARAYTVTDLNKEKQNIETLMAKYKETPSDESFEKITALLTKTVSKMQEQVANILPAFEISNRVFAAK